MMLRIEGVKELFCDFCHLAIMRQRHARVKRPEASGESEVDYFHLHRRELNDCYCKWAKV